MLLIDLYIFYTIFVYDIISYFFSFFLNVVLFFKSMLLKYILFEIKKHEGKSNYINFSYHMANFMLFNRQ